MLKRDTRAYAKSPPPAGFVTDTLILTPQGVAFIQDLTSGDLVITRDHGPQPLRALHRALSPSRAITVAPEAIGPGLPWRHLRLSPTQRIAVTGWKAALLFGQDETLVPVGDLLSDGSILARPTIGSTVIYQPVFDNPQIIYVEGIEVEVAMQRLAQLHVAKPAHVWSEVHLES